LSAVAIFSTWAGVNQRTIFASCAPCVVAACASNRVSVPLYISSCLRRFAEPCGNGDGLSSRKG
jgi:hypothetical protein